jgi:drug/metabolite transporter (DMT)-like permease
MPFQAIALLILSAFLHASYNALYKKSGDKQVFAWWFMLITVVVYSWVPVLTSLHFPWQGWLCIIASGVFEAAYYIAMSEAYERGDLSLVYPLARGVAPLLVTLWATLFFGERPQIVGLAGILLIAGGTYLLNTRSFSLVHLLDPLRALKKGPSRLALLASLCISVYSVIDKVGVGYVPPFVYVYLVLCAAFALFTPYILFVTGGRKIAVEWRVNKVNILTCGVLLLLTYSLALQAMRLAYVSYVASVRESSIVFSALLGYFFLKEQYGTIRVMASTLVFLGVLCIGLATWLK